MIDQGNLINSSRQVFKIGFDRAWSSQEWKSEVTAHDRSGKPDETSWNVVQQVAPHHGETLLDGNAHSVRCGGMLRDRSRQFDNFSFQEVADSEIFVMGSDAAEFANKVKKSSAKKTEKNVERCRLRRRTLNN